MGSRMTPVGAVVRGVLAGAAGTAAMDAVWYARYRKGGGTSGFPEWETAAGLDSFQDAPAPAQVGRRVAEGLLRRELKPRSARLVTNLVHWGYGIAWGAAYGIVAGSIRRPRTTDGLLFGPIVWSTGYLVLPRTGIYKPIQEYDARTLWQDASAHLAFGVGTAAAFKLLARRRWTVRPSDPTREPGDAEFDDAAVDYDGAARTFDQVEWLHVRKRLEPDFDWLDFDQPSQRNALRMPVRDARVGLVVTAGVRLPDQRPARQIGEVRHLPVTASQVRLTHGGYDTRRAMRDPDVVFPVRTLRRLAEAGAIGSLAPIAASTMGYIPKGLNVLDRVVPPVVASLVAQQVDLALLVPAWPVCQQSVGLLQRGLDHAGIPTVSITQAPSISRHARPSLAVFVAHPFGLTLGAPGDDTTHQAVIRTVLAQAERDHPAGTIVATQFRWPDDLRALQLRKQAH